MVVRQKLILTTKYVCSYYEKFVNNPDSKDMNNTTDEKNSALISACASRGTDSATLVCLLLDAGADIEAITYDGGPTPRCVACKNNVPATVQLLCDCGADVNAQDSKPMWLACRYDRPKIAEILLAHGACIDPPSCFHGNTD